MSDVINKTTLEYRRSVHTPDYSKDAAWLINPILPACESQFWKYDILGNRIVEMSAADKAALQKAIDAEAAKQQTLTRVWTLIKERNRDDSLSLLVAEGKVTQDEAKLIASDPLRSIG